MKFIEVPEFGDLGQLHLSERDAPQPKAGEITIDVRASGINFADIMAVSGDYPNVPSAPYRPGFEVAGEVSALGDGVDNWKVGDRAMALVKEGGYSEQLAVAAEQAAPVPEPLDYAGATALLVQGLTAFYLLDSAPLHEGEVVLLSSAAGGVGSMAIQIAGLKGASKVIGLASPRGHERVRELGAEPVDYRESGWADKAKELSGRDGVDVFLDSIGALDGEGFEALGRGARWMIFGGQGHSDAPLAKERVWKMLFQSITLRGFGLNPEQYDVARGLKQLSEWAAAGKLEADAPHRYPLAHVRQAFEDITNRKTHGKVVLEP